MLEKNFKKMATINEEEKNLIAEIERELESELCDYFGKHPFNLLRWIRGWNGDLKEILPRLRRHLELRRCLKLDEIQNQSYLQGMAESQIHFYPTGIFFSFHPNFIQDFYLIIQIIDRKFHLKIFLLKSSIFIHSIFILRILFKL